MQTKTSTQQTDGTVDRTLQKRVNRLARKGLDPGAIERQLRRAGWGRRAIKAALENAAHETFFSRMMPKAIVLGVAIVVLYFAYPWIAGLLNR